MDGKGASDRSESSVRGRGCIAGWSFSYLETAVILKKAPGQAIAPGEEPDVSGTDGVVDGVPAAVAALEDGLGADAVEVLGPVAQHRPAEVDASAAGPL